MASPWFIRGARYPKQFPIILQQLWLIYYEPIQTPLLDENDVDPSSYLAPNWNLPWLYILVFWYVLRHAVEFFFCFEGFVSLACLLQDFGWIIVQKF